MDVLRLPTLTLETRKEDVETLLDPRGQLLSIGDDEIADALIKVTASRLRVVTRKMFAKRVGFDSQCQILVDSQGECYII